MSIADIRQAVASELKEASPSLLVGYPAPVDVPDRYPALVVLTHNLQPIEEGAWLDLRLVVLVRVGKTNEDSTRAEDEMNAIQAEVVKWVYRNKGERADGLWQAAEVTDVSPITNATLDGENYAIWSVGLRLTLGEAQL